MCQINDLKIGDAKNFIKNGNFFRYKYVLYINTYSSSRKEGL